MTRPGRSIRAGALAAAALILVPAGVIGAGPAGPAAARARSDRFTITVNSITPESPKPTQTPSPLSVELTIESSKPLDGVRIIGERGDPLQNQTALDAAITAHSPPIGSGVPITPHPAMAPLSLAPNTPVTVSFTTTTSTLNDGSSGICLCTATAVYPLYFSADQTVNGVDQQLGVASTYLPAFYPEGFHERLLPVNVSWLWPLLDRPHRLTGETEFTDDQLAAEVGPDGRLTRALQVVQAVASSVPLTLVVDPEMLDELWVMANEPYVVRDDTKLVPGAGKQAAAAWLEALRTVLSANSDLQVELTPYADPNVEAVTANGLTWANSLPDAATAAHVSDALGGRALDATVAWPAAGAIGRATLAELAKDGISTVVLNASAVTPRPAQGAVPPGLARLRVAGSDIPAALTDAQLQRYAARTMNPPSAGSSALPELLAELAIRAAQEPDVQHTVLITPPRYVDPDVPSAVETVKATSRSTFAQPIALRDAGSGALLPIGRSRLARVPASAEQLSNATLGAAKNAASKLPAIRSMLDTKQDVGARQFVQSLPRAIQRAESSAWSDQSQSRTAGTYAGDLNALIDDVTSGVRIISPSSGAYTLASSSSPLPITVDNELPYPVNVRIHIGTIPPRLPGFSTSQLPVERVDSKQKRTIKVPTTIDRPGRIRIKATLTTPNGGVELGSQDLTVRSTALGVIGVIITIAAGVVLLLALLIRFVRRVRRRSSGGQPLPPVRIDEPEPAT